MQGKSQVLRAESPSTHDLAVIDRRIEGTARQSQALYRAAKSWIAWMDSPIGPTDKTYAEQQEMLDDLREAVEFYEKVIGIDQLEFPNGPRQKRRGVKP